MLDDDARIDAATALRDLIHEFSARDPDDALLRSVAATARAEADALRTHPLRDRRALMRAAVGGASPAGFSDRAVGGAANPTGVELSVEFEADEVVAEVVLRRAFEGAPGRAHGGIVAAAFDDVTGFVIGMLHEPAYTGELTVRYLAPVPVDETLVMRARLDGRERRKLFISADAHAGEQAGGHLVATCRAIYITVDPARFAGAPEPR
ncbi:MAG TPA: PaaI family thioesterase [Acidimicrobiia bacterium]|jgi:acyl-coenzyme A thioesterase PaaI-like protein|nr:PaaI family thioesterase [Acidimicrobiia bacterium]